MIDLRGRRPPDSFDWETWVRRWDRMQERYLVSRTERFETIVRLLRGVSESVKQVLDLGCGTGTLMLHVLKVFPEARVCGIDFDPTMLWLAEARLAEFAERSQVLLLDLRDPSWAEAVPSPVDAIVSATALHWLEEDRLAGLYRNLASVLRPGGLFLNADHVGSDSPGIQKAWELHRSEMRRQQAGEDSDDWEGFWRGYSKALGLDADEIHKRVIGAWEGGVEEGLPLAWHLDKLRDSGFTCVDCFWRYDCDAIYGGIRGD